MKKLLNFFLPIGFLYFLGILSTVHAANSSSDETAAGLLLGGYFGFIILYYCLICLYFFGIISHIILSVVTIIDIAKKPNEAIEKEFWIMVILLTPLIPFIGVFIALGAEGYYLIKIRPQLPK